MEKKSTTVRIGGMEYPVSGYETEEYMQSVAIYVDRKMNEIKKNCFNLDTSMLAVLTAINLADENIKLYERIEELEKQLQNEQKSKSVTNAAKNVASTTNRKRNN